MIEIILLSVFIISIAGTAAILLRKMPLAQKTAAASLELNSVNLGQAAKGWCLARIKKMPYLRDFDWMEFAQKILMRGRVAVLKAENKINDYMIKLRQKAEAEQKKDGQVLDNYWHDLKTMVKAKKLGNYQAVNEAVTESAGLKVKAVYPQETKGQAILTTVENNDVLEPAISRVAMPDAVSQKNVPHFNKRKRFAKKKKVKDPFKW